MPATAADEPQAPLPDRTALRVGDVMERRFVTLSPGESALEAERLMRLARLRHVPVVDGRILVGLLAQRTVLEASLALMDGGSRRDHETALERLPIERLMEREPTTVLPGCPLAEAARRMLRLRLGCLPVVETGPSGPELVGLLTETDLLRAAYAPDFAVG